MVAMDASGDSLFAEDARIHQAAHRERCAIRE
jgi:hypothetical protein